MPVVVAVRVSFRTCAQLVLQRPPQDQGQGCKKEQARKEIHELVLLRKS
jgi:hypothetical protein